jgi:hypothetical protein
MFHFQKLQLLICVTWKKKKKQYPRFVEGKFFFSHLLLNVYLIENLSWFNLKSENGLLLKSQVNVKVVVLSKKKTQSDSNAYMA